MKQQQQRTVDSLTRVEGFLDANAATVGALGNSAGRVQLSTSVTTVAAFDNTQGSADLRMAGQKNRERSLAIELRTAHMQPIATFARSQLRGVPDFAALTRSTAQLNRAKLVRAARAMATAAAPYVDALVRGGFPADTLTQLSNSADALEGALADRANTKVGRVSATKGIELQLQAGREAVTMLHAVISKQFAGDPVFLAGWNSARRITAKSGGQRAAASSAPVPSPAPALVSVAA